MIHLKQSALFCFFYLLSAFAGAATLTFPGVAPCNTTLQACITGATSGDVIEIATNTPIDEALDIDKSLTLRPAAGFTPMIGGGVTQRILDFNNLGTAGTETLIIEGLVFNFARIDGFVTNGTGHSITIRNNTFNFEFANNNTNAISIDTRVPITALIENNDITSTGSGISLTAIVTGAVGYQVERNIITTSLPAESSSGIEVDLRGTGTYTVDIFSNVVYGVTGCNCGGSSGVGIDILSTPTVILSLTNNTVDRSEAGNGFQVLVRDAGSNTTVNLFNNIASNSDRSGFSLRDISGGGTTIALNADNNNSFNNNNADEFFGLPPGTILAENPFYFDPLAGILQLQTISLLINNGTDAPTGGNSTLAAGGTARILGPQIDIGAYELAIGSIPTLSVTALTMLVVLLLFTGIMAQRNRISI